MRTWQKVGGALAGALVAGGWGALLAGNARWERDTARLLERFAHAPITAPDPAMVAALPAPVQHWLGRALAPGTAPPHAMLVRQEGTFLTGAPDGWSPFTATSHFAARPPGFVWDARIRMAPGLAIRVRDSYVGGEGRMHGALAGLVTMVDQRGTPAMAEASLQRFIAEAAWLPSALLPCEGVTWAPVDDSTARVTVRDAGVAGTVTFHFTPGGDVSGITADRWRDVDGTPVLTPWSGRFHDWATIDGVRLPLEGEVGWTIDGRYEPYWRGRITHAEYAR